MKLVEPMYDFVIALLKEKIPQEYCYHDYNHTEYIYQRAIEIAGAENCNENELALIKIAALWHDVGYINTYNNHEEEGCKLVKKHLPHFGISQSDIGIVCNMIMATKFPQQPCTKLEEILADADLSYLGTLAPAAIADQLFFELKYRNSSLTKNAWNQVQIAFIKSHRYFTNYCICNYEPLKQEYLHQLVKATQAG